jgi:predicted oxidoreductase (fatty acid repression mutant protein)
MAGAPTFQPMAESSKMRKRAVDLSLEELAAMGADAALKAVQKAQDAGLTVFGTVDFLEDGRIVSSLAERLPSGAVSLPGASAARTSALSSNP